MLIGGAGSHRAALERQVGELGLDKHVTFLGFVPDADLPRYYQAADVFVLPTRELEGFGLVTAEALACGTPVLGTPVGATPELLETLDPGLVFQDATAGAMEADLTASSSTGSRATPRRPPTSAWPVDATPSRASAGSTWWTRSSGRSATCSRVVRSPKRARRPARPAVARWCCRGCSTTASATGCASSAAPGAWPSCPPPPRCSASTSSATSAASRPRRSPGRGAIDARLGPGADAEPGRAGPAARRRLRRRSSRARRRATTAGAPPAPICRTRRARSPPAAGPVVQADARALPFAGATFDALTLVNVLDHTINPLPSCGRRRACCGPAGSWSCGFPTPPSTRRGRRCSPTSGRWCAGAAGTRTRFSTSSRSRPARCAAWSSAPGFDVVTLRNSTLAAAAPDAAATRRGNAGRRILRRLTAALAGTARTVTAGRWLVGPSIEVYARRRGGAGA